MTVEGIDAVAQPIRTYPAKLGSLVIGAGTFRAYQAFDQLLAFGVQPNSLRVHLGHSRQTTAGAQHAFYRYHPMLHSKVYLFDQPGAMATAFVGSHNITGFALLGLNGEAAVVIEGAANSPELIDVRTHVQAAIDGSVQYDPANRDAYAWWAWQFMEGLSAKFNDIPRDGEAVRTIVILAEATEAQSPKRNEVIYFELPAALGKVQSMKADVHIFLFKSLPQSPFAALSQIAAADSSYWCKAIGIEDDRGGRELQAHWQIDSANRPLLRRAPRPFRPSPRPDVQQVRVQVFGTVHEKYEYLFETGKASFEPVFEREHPLSLPADREPQSRALKLIPPEHLPWFRVTAIRRREPGVRPDDRYHTALRKLSPEAGSFILMSPRRRKSMQ